MSLLVIREKVKVYAKMNEKIHIEDFRTQQWGWIDSEIKAESGENQPASSKPIVAVEFLSERGTDWKGEDCGQVLEVCESE